MYLDPTTSQLVEDYKDEVLSAFAKADWEIREQVEVLYLIDSRSGKDIELWRKDCLDLAKSLN